MTQEILNEEKSYSQFRQQQQFKIASDNTLEDFKLLSQDVLRAMRGERTQLEMSKKLGFDYNQYHKWESGQKRFYFSDFVSLCMAEDIPIQRILELLDNTSYEGVELNFKNICAKQLNLIPFVEKIWDNKILDVTKSTIERWKRGTAEPEFAIFLYVLNYMKDCLLEFLGVIIDINLIPSLTEEQEKRTAQIEAYSSRPYCISVQFALSLKQYMDSEIHDESLLRELTGLSLEKVQESIQILRDCKIIYEKDGKYLLASLGLKLSHMNIEQSAMIGNYYTKKSLERFETPNGVPTSLGDASNLWAYRVAPISKRSEPKVKSIISKALSDITEIIVEDQHSGDLDTVKAFVFHYFDTKTVESKDTLQ